MNVRRIILISLVTSLAAMAQSAPPSQRVAPQTARRQASPMVPKKKAASPRAASARVQHAAPKRVEANTMRAAGKRDPFISPVRIEGPGGGPNCSVGKKCLAPDAIVLKGIAATPSGAIAVVVNARTSPPMTYFLRENDPLFNGYVVKITSDSIVMRENVVDRLGKESTRDIVKKVNAPAV